MSGLTDHANERSLAKAQKLVARFNAQYLRLNALFPAYGNTEDSLQIDKKLRLMQAIDSLSRRLGQKTCDMSPEIREWIINNRDVSGGEVDVRNTEELKTIIGHLKEWPTMSIRASKAAWLIVQHADHDLGFQRDILDQYSNFIDSRAVAYLHDRIATQAYKADSTSEIDDAESRARSPDAPKQRYGTQGRIVDGHWAPWPIENPESLERRRREVGLETMAQYFKRMNPQKSMSLELARN